jgi:hypothetical protein
MPTRRSPGAEAVRPSPELGTGLAAAFSFLDKDGLGAAVESLMAVSRYRLVYLPDEGSTMAAKVTSKGADAMVNLTKSYRPF